MLRETKPKMEAGRVDRKRKSRVERSSWTGGALLAGLGIADSPGLWLSVARAMSQAQTARTRPRRLGLW